MAAEQHSIERTPTPGRQLHPLVQGRGFLESPRWHDGRLWCSDFWSREIISVDEAGRCDRQAYVPGQPSGFGFLGDGGILAASVYDRSLVTGRPGRVLYPRVTTYDVYPGELNDMVVSEQGTAYVSPFDAGGPTSGRVDPDHVPKVPLLMVQGNQVRRVAEDLAGPNGLALVDGGAVLIVAETFGQRLTSFDVGADGRLTHPRTYADLAGRHPDGIAVDANRAVWVACPFEEEVIHVAEGGEIIEVVSTEGRWAVATALGGPDGRTLFCTTARTTLRQFLQGQGTGAVETTRVDTPAFGWT